jgi:signal transduction histidine kinase
VRKHAQASSVEVVLACEDEWVVLTVKDDGVGTDSLSSPAGHLGLVSMHERAEIAGGHVQIQSARGRGAIVQCTVPRTAR